MRRSRSNYSKKRKFHGNQHQKAKNTTVPSGDANQNQNDQSPASQVSASGRKIPNAKRPRFDDNIKPNEESIVSGYRFVDMAILSFVFRMLPCKECFECSLIQQEMNGKRKGCASNLMLLCCSCGRNNQFFTSSQISRFYEVDRRLVYAMRSIGCGHAKCSKRGFGRNNECCCIRDS